MTRRQADPADLFTLFCHTLSPRRRFRVDRMLDHTYRDEPIPATSPGVPYAVYLTAGGRFRQLVFDLDATAGADVVEEDLQRLRELLDDVGIIHIVTRSGRNGGRHVWAAFPAGAPTDLVGRIGCGLAALLPSLDLGTLTNPATGCARPPGSPHRHGGTAELHTPADPTAAAAILTTGNPPERLELLYASLPPAARGNAIATPAAATETRPVVDDPVHGPHLAGPRRALTPGTDQMLYHHEANVDTSATTWSILLRCAHARFTRADVERLLADPAATGLEHLRTRRTPTGRTARTAAERTALLHRQWAKAVQVAAEMPRSNQPGPDPRVEAVTAAVAAVEATARANAWRWATPAGPADREALKALCLVALASCSLTIALDCRRWATMTGFAKSTMAAAGHRLATDHPIDGPAWITLDTPGDGTTATVWRLPEAEPAGSHDDETPAQSDTVDKTRTQGRQPAPPTRVTSPVSGKAVLGSSRESLRDLLERELATAAHDVWTPLGGLGHSRQRTYAAVLDGHTTITEISDATAYTQRTVRRHLRVLQQHQLLQHDRHGSVRPGPAGLDAVAATLQVAGTGVRRERSYVVDRELYAWWRDEQQWRTTRGKPNKRRRTPIAPGQHTIPVQRGPRAIYGPFPVRSTPTGPGRAAYAEARHRVQAHLAGEPMPLPQPPRGTIPAPRRPAAAATTWTSVDTDELQSAAVESTLTALQLAFDLELTST